MKIKWFKNKIPSYGTYVLIGNMAYDLHKLPFMTRWKIKIKHMLGMRIDAL